MQRPPLESMLMRIYVSESARSEGVAAHRVILKALEAGGLRGAIAFKGIEGYGASRQTSAASVVDAVADLPILIEVVDTCETIEAFVPQLDELLQDGFVTLERLHVRG